MTSVHVLVESAIVAPPPCALAIGNFDGVHRGHAAVIASVVAQAKERGLVPAVLTFDPHPALAFGRSSPPILATFDRKVELFDALGIERVYVQRFDAGFASTPASAFAEGLLVRRLAARFVMVGQNFRFGHGRAGDITMLRDLGARLGFEAHVFDLVALGATSISSTRIRESIRSGDVELASELLGRPHSISGVVSHGKKLGRTIGFPTANLRRVAEVLPALGVYAVVVDRMTAAGEPIALGQGVMNVGLRPTVEGGATVPRCEVHLFDFDQELYGETLRVHLASRIREEKKFGSVEELREQIQADVVVARQRLAGYT